MAEPRYKSPDDVEYLDEDDTLKVLEAATAVLNNFPILAHDLAMVGAAVHATLNQIPDDESIDAVLAVSDANRQVFTHYVSALASATTVLMQHIATQEGAKLDKKIIDAAGNPLRPN